MTACPDQTMLLHGLLDGELDAANALACEAHLKTCEACHAEYQSLRALRETITRPGVAHAAPERLRARIEATLDTPTMRPAAGPKRRIMPWATSGAAIAAGLAVVLALPSLTDSGLERELVASHVRSLLANHLIDIETSNQHVVRPWFNGKVDIAPPVPELADEGFPLVGGRLDYIEGRVAPAIVYRRRLHTVNLFVLPAEGSASGAVHTARRDGYSVVEWTQGGLRFAAVSDIDLADLKQFHEAFVERTPR